MNTPHPKISIVTPSFNQGRFLETTICSILDQNYPNLEYIVMDGGSTDNSVEILRKYEKHFAYWQSEKDRGQNHALTEGFKHATGEIFAYLNSDDIYLPWTLATIANIFTHTPNVEWLTSRTTLVIDAANEPIMANHAIAHTRRRFYKGMTLGNVKESSGWIQQEATFWRRGLWGKAGARMEESLYLAGDFELWARFYQHAELVTTLVPLAAFRLHSSNKTQLNEYIRVAKTILARYPRERQDPSRSLKNWKWLDRFARGKPPPDGSRHCWVSYDPEQKTWQYHSIFIR